MNPEPSLPEQAQALAAAIVQAAAPYAAPGAEPPIVVLFPGKNALAVLTAKRLALEGHVQPLLLGPELPLFDLCLRHRANPDQFYGIVDPAHPPMFEDYIATWMAAHPAATRAEAVAATKVPATFAALLVARGEAHFAWHIEQGLLSL